MASRLAGWLAARGLRDDPVVLCNKSHSGSRLLARLLDRAGLFLGAHRNESEDAWDLLPVVRYLVIRHYPDYRATAADALLPDLLEAALARHLEGIAPGQPWGWKLSESGFILPVLAALLPRLRVVHLLRDGRDVAFSDHTGPTDAFWRKVFFDRDDIATWRGLALTGPAYRRRPHLFNARHWANAVAVTRRCGQTLGPRYRGMRCEALCARPRESLAGRRGRHRRHRDPSGHGPLPPGAAPPSRRGAADHRAAAGRAGLSDRWHLRPAGCSP